MSTNKKAAFFDIDGTIWDRKNFIPPSAIEGIRRFREKGNYAFLCTGRARAYVTNPKLFEVGFDGIVCGCGTHVELDGKMIYEKLLGEDLAKLTLETVRRHKFRPIFEGPGHLYMDYHEFDDKDDFGNRIRSEMKEGLLSITGNENNIVANKLSCATENIDTEPCFKELSEYYDYIVHCPEVVEIIPKGHTKATGIKKMCEYLRIDIKDTIAFGDGENDVDMLKFAGTSVAMGDGSDNAKAVATLVTTPLHEDGIYNALIKLGLI